MSWSSLSVVPFRQCVTQKLNITKPHVEQIYGKDVSEIGHFVLEYDIQLSLTLRR